MHAPRFHARFGDNDAAGFGHRNEMFEDERIAPSHRLGRIADSAIFIAVWIFHQDRSDPVRAQLRAERAIVLPETFVVMTDLRAVQIDAATRAKVAMFAKLAGGLRGFFDFKHLAAKCAFGAGFSGYLYHLNYAWRREPGRIGSWHHQRGNRACKSKHRLRTFIFVKQAVKASIFHKSAARR